MAKDPDARTFTWLSRHTTTRTARRFAQAILDACEFVDEHNPKWAGIVPLTVAEAAYALWNDFVFNVTDDTIPHCDSRILHESSECSYCARPDWQAERARLKIAFTGHEPNAGEFPCPADAARPAGTESDHRRWGGNKPTSAEGDAAWPVETSASQMFYGDMGGRV